MIYSKVSTSDKSKLNVENFIDFKTLTYPLPNERIAQFPLHHRGQSRLMLLDQDQGIIGHGKFNTLYDLLDPGDLCVFNKTKVIPAKFIAYDSVGRPYEFLYVTTVSKSKIECLCAKRKQLIDGMKLRCGDITLQVLSVDPFLLISNPFISKSEWHQWLRETGSTPLPPYIQRTSLGFDVERYQSTLAEIDGSIAAPTASLHFSKHFLKQISNKGVIIDYLFLHCGIGTFLPIRNSVQEHTMHTEPYEVTESLLQNIQKAIKNNKRIVAIGTTVVRALESFYHHKQTNPGSYDTDLFIQTGYSFKIISALVTNFHGPRSTPLALVSAFSNPSLISKSYQLAILKKFRFLSYGDAMVLGRFNNQ